MDHFNEHTKKDSEEMASEEEAKKGKDFTLYQTLHKNNGRKQSELLYFYFRHVFDQPINQIEEFYYSYLLEMCNVGQFDDTNVGVGISHFLNVYPDQVLDIPILKTYFSKTIAILLHKNLLDPKDIILNHKINSLSANEEEGDLPTIDDYYSLIAHILVEQYKKYESWKDVAKFYETSGLQKQLRAMYRLILVDDLFKLVEEEIGEEYGKYITLLIDQDEKDSQKNQEKFNKISSK